MPQSISPMLCLLTREPVNDPAYLFEIKWDGYRIISYVNNGTVRMDSRSALDYTKKYPPIVAALKALTLPSCEAAYTTPFATACEETAPPVVAGLAQGEPVDAIA